MLFNSFEFGAFLLILLPFFHALSRKKGYCGASRTFLLLCSSLVFYAWGDLRLLPLLLVSFLANSLGALLVAKQKYSAKPIVTTLVLFNVLILCFFKYASLIGGLFLNVETALFGKFSLQQIPLPIGISFFTFQGISLILDVSRDQKLREYISKNSFWISFLRISNYICFFPQLVAGPIVKARDFLPQYEKKTSVNWMLALRFLIFGFFFKMVVADNLKDYTELLSQPNFGGLSSIGLLIALYAYSFQIYADFFGYSLIAVGLGLLFGFKLPKNFDIPYTSRSFSEFWQRWHISLSSWLREYLYFPLGGNRKGYPRMLFNLMLVMLIGGIWHGAAWKYLLWGGGHGLVLIIERLIFKNKLPRAEKAFEYKDIFRILIVFHTVTILWLFFVLPDSSSFFTFWDRVFYSGFSYSPLLIYGAVIFSIPIVLQHLLAMRYKLLTTYFDIDKINPCIAKSSFGEVFLLGTLLASIILNAGAGGAFIYFQF